MSQFDAMLSINRNIVECKDVNVLNAEKNLKCINRNIVECKEEDMYGRKNSKVSINRNIVECKEGMLCF